MSEVAKGSEGVPSEAGDIWLASPKESGVLTGRGPRGEVTGWRHT